MVAALGRRHRVLHGNRGLARAGRSHEQGAGAAIRSATEQGVERGDAALDPFAWERHAVLRRDQTRENDDAIRLDGKIMESTPVIRCPGI